ncbi:hypothetical protein, partial [Halopelagius longus]
MTFLSYPTRVGSAASLAAAVGTVALVAPDGASALSLAAAVALVVLGALAARTAVNVSGDGGIGRKSLGAILLAVGAGLAVGGVGVGVLAAETLPHRLVVASGLLGVCL